MAQAIIIMAMSFFSKIKSLASTKQSFGVQGMLSAAGESVANIMKLQKSETASTILPPDTKFAIVVEAILKEANESFYEVDSVRQPVIPTFGNGGVGINAGGASSISSEGMVGRFVGYICCSDTKLRVYQTLDINNAAHNDGLGDMVASFSDKLQFKLILEDDLTNISIMRLQGDVTLKNDSHQVKIVQPFAISHPASGIESSATGFYNGLNPLKKFIVARGAHALD